MPQRSSSNGGTVVDLDESAGGLPRGLLPGAEQIKKEEVMTRVSSISTEQRSGLFAPCAVRGVPRHRWRQGAGASPFSCQRHHARRSRSSQKTQTMTTAGDEV